MISRKTSTLLAFSLLLIMGIAALASTLEDAVTTDESPHITSGYSYLKFQDMRLNPEHPPLVKDAAAIPLLFKDINFPTDHPAWTSMINAQWDLGPQFLYRSGNNPDEIIFWGRIAPILIMLLFGWFVFKWARELFGPAWGLFALALFIFSPNIIAHGRLVTTDVPAAAAFFISIYYYLKLLKNPSWKNLAIAGAIFAIAQLTKFSLVLIIGFLPALTFLWIIIRARTFPSILHDTGIWAIRFLGILAITALLILPAYQFHVANYPPEKQAADIQYILQSNKFPALTDALVWMSDKPILRSYAQYILGVSMVFMRVAGGNTTYFLGEVSNQAWWYYFPVVFFLKEPSAILILLALAFSLSLKRLGRTYKKLLPAIQNNFDEIAMLLFVIFYWVISITGNLNIGVRHVLPTLPFLYLLIAGQLKRWFNEKRAGRAMNFFRQSGKASLVGALVLWNAVTFVGIYPYFLAYFNEFAGGPAGGYRYVVDSNLDWGQDLRRLAKFVEKNNIDKIKIDYFGGGDVKYYLGDKAEIWHADNGSTTGLPCRQRFSKHPAPIPGPPTNGLTNMSPWKKSDSRFLCII